jgi:hypothetical protein
MDILSAKEDRVIKVVFKVVTQKPAKVSVTEPQRSG